MIVALPCTAPLGSSASLLALPLLWQAETIAPQFGRPWQLLQRGDFSAAEQTLRPEVKSRPHDAAALTLLGVALDSQKKFQEAEEFHRRAVADAPNSPDVWNNYANHLLATGDESGCRQTVPSSGGARRRRTITPTSNSPAWP